MADDGLSDSLRELRADLISQHAEDTEVQSPPEGNDAPATQSPPEAEAPAEEPEPAPPMDTDPVDVATPEVTEEAQSEPVGVPEEPQEVPHQYIPPPPPDMVEGTGPAPYPMRAENTWASAQSIDVASMPLADFELFLFPEMGHAGYEAGQRTLARVMANLASAGYYPEPWQAQVAASLWARKTYKNTDVDMTRKILERAPAAEIQGLMPKTHSAAAEMFQAEEPEPSKWQTMDKGTAVVGGITLLAVMIPFLIGRKK